MIRPDGKQPHELPKDIPFPVDEKLEGIKIHYRNLPPHVKERESGKTIKYLLTLLDEREKENKDEFEYKY